MHGQTECPKGKSKSHHLERKPYSRRRMVLVVLAYIKGSTGLNAGNPAKDPAKTTRRQIAGVRPCNYTQPRSASGGCLIYTRRRRIRGHVYLNFMALAEVRLSQGRRHLLRCGAPSFFSGDSRDHPPSVEKQMKYVSFGLSLPCI